MLGGIRDIEYNEGNSSFNLRQFKSHWISSISLITSEQIKSGEFFYGLLHRRYVLTNAGINKILKNFDEGKHIETKNETINQNYIFKVFTENVKN